MKIFTIGFTKKPASVFFESLKAAGVSRLVDVRLNNVSQLAGFAKKNDLGYFLRTICGIDYLHLPELAPTGEMLDEYRKTKSGWDLYERRFLELIDSRNIEKTIDPATIDGACLLCSEEKPHHCHRRLVAEYLRDRWNGVTIEHLP